jgi:hypothetical protein
MVDHSEARSPSEGRLTYVPNPAHKVTTSEAGPPRWHPDKAACPTDLSPGEMRSLMEESLAEDDDPLNPRRYALRRVGNRSEWFTSRLTRRRPDGTIEIHGHPIDPERERIPPKVLRRFRHTGRISKSEYKRLV